MIVKIRFPQGHPRQHGGSTNKDLTAAAGALLVPASLMAYSLGFWRLAFDLGLAGQFDITGAFSHWQLWIGLGVLLHTGSITLNRYSRGEGLEMPRVLGALPGRRDAVEDELEHQHSLR